MFHSMFSLELCLLLDQPIKQQVKQASQKQIKTERSNKNKNKKKQKEPSEKPVFSKSSVEVDGRKKNPAGDDGDEEYYTKHSSTDSAASHQTTRSVQESGISLCQSIKKPQREASIKH